MRQSRQMLTSVARCLSQHRPYPVTSHPSVACEGSRLVGGRHDLPGHCSTSLVSGGIEDLNKAESLYCMKQREAVHCASQQRRGFLSVGDGDEDMDMSRHHEESLVIGYSPEQLYSVVAAVDLYEDFVPWCQKSSIVWSRDDALEADLEIGFKFFVERYTSHVELRKPYLIKTSVTSSSLFDYLTNIWEFKPGPNPHSTNLHFVVEFQFRSLLHRKVADMFFNEVAQQLVGSFEKRCRTVYGPSCKVMGTHKMPVLSG